MFYERSDQGSLGAPIEAADGAKRDTYICIASINTLYGKK